MRSGSDFSHRISRITSYNVCYTKLLREKGDGKNKKLLGGKGANLCEMTQIGIPVPPGFVITTEACIEYLESGNKMPKGLMAQVSYNFV